MSNRTLRSRGNVSISGNGNRRLRRLFMATAATAGSIGLGVFGATLLAQPAGAVTVTLTVATAGTDAGNCVSSPCATLGYALSQAAAGATIGLHPRHRRRRLRGVDLVVERHRFHPRELDLGERSGRRPARQRRDGPELWEHHREQ